MLFHGLGCERIDQTDEFGLGPRLGGHGYANGDKQVDGEGEDSGPEVLCHVAGVGMDDADPGAVDAWRVARGNREAVVDECAEGACDESTEGTVSGGALPEHAEQKGCEQRRVDKGKDELQRVHDVVEAGSEVGGADGEDDA